MDGCPTEKQAGEGAERRRKLSLTTMLVLATLLLLATPATDADAVPPPEPRRP